MYLERGDSPFELERITQSADSDQSAYKLWLQHTGLDDLSKISPEDLKARLIGIVHNIENSLIRQEPGFPAELAKLARAPWVRGEIGNELSMLENESDTRPPQVRIGYEGLDVEIWALKEGKLRHISFKRQGYKALNSLLAHEGADAIRDTILVTLEHFNDQIAQFVIDNFDNPEAISQYLLSLYDQSIIPAEKQILAAHGVAEGTQGIIYGTRIGISGTIDVRETNRALTTELEIRADLPDDEYDKRIFERQRRILNMARRQTELASKHMQLLSLHQDSPYQDDFSMRSMVQSIQPSDRELLTLYLNNRLGDRVGIPHFVTERGDIGQYLAYQEYMEPLPLVEEEQEASASGQSFLTREFLDTWPAAAQALAEVYERPIYDVQQIHRQLSRLNNIAQGLYTDLRLGRWKNIEEDLEEYYSEAAALVEQMVTKNGEYFSNDTLVKEVIGNALEKDHILFVQVTDREGMLFLNARLGVDKVDAGLHKQSVVAQRAVARIQQSLQGSLRGVVVEAAYCLRNVDENTFAIRIDPDTIDIEDHHVMRFLVRQYGADVLSLSDREKKTLLCEYFIQDAFTQMIKEMDEIPELKTHEEGEVFDSFATGVWFAAEPSQFGSIEDVLKTADGLSELFKRGRAEVVNKIPEEMVRALVYDLASQIVELSGHDKKNGVTARYVKEVYRSMTDINRGPRYYVRLPDGRIGVHLPFPYKVGQYANYALNRVIYRTKRVFSDVPTETESVDVIPAMDLMTPEGLQQTGDSPAFIKPIDRISPLSNLQGLIARLRVENVASMFVHAAKGKKLPETLGIEEDVNRYVTIKRLASLWESGRITSRTTTSDERRESVARFRETSPIVKSGINLLMHQINENLKRRSLSSSRS